MKVVVAGGTGFIGRALCARLADAGHEVSALVRSHAASLLLPRSVRPLDWSPPAPGPWEEALEGADAVVNLAGEPVAGGRWTEGRKLRILESRVLATGALVAAAAKARRRPKRLLNGSAVGYYGDLPEGDAPESLGPGSDFLARVCVCWEEAARKAEPLGLRVALLRTGHVLAADGGILAKMTPPFRFFVGGPLGSGRQWLPWIHRHDEVEAILFCLERGISGPVNLCAPAPERMGAFCRELGQALHRPAWASVPPLALRLLLGEMAGLVLGGQRAVPAKLTSAGFAFRFPLLGEALKDLFR